jgi:hypothetical protein
MATIKEAVQNAKIFARENLEPERVAGLQLEEVESASTGGEETWLITLSVIDPEAVPPIFSPSLGPRREYKVFTVLKENGEVTSMKIRELATT